MKLFDARPHRNLCIVGLRVFDNVMDGNAMNSWLKENDIPILFG